MNTKYANKTFTNRKIYIVNQITYLLYVYVKCHLHRLSKHFRWHCSRSNESASWKAFQRNVHRKWYVTLLHCRFVQAMKTQNSNDISELISIDICMKMIILLNQIWNKSGKRVRDQSSLREQAEYKRKIKEIPLFLDNSVIYIVKPLLSAGFYIA